LTTFSLEFLPSAQKEWDKLGATVREQFTRKLRERLAEPHVPAARLSDLPNCYKIKLRAAGYRLVYRVDDGRVVVIVVAVGKRDRNAVYKIAAGRV
jgi:mRNA interferase RelE/StbE